MLAVSYNPVLLAGAALLAVMAGFTGLSLTRGVSRMPVAGQQAAIVRAAAVLGGGVWSTHFVAMLALQLPVDVVYHPVFTLASALIAILVTGAALLVLHVAGRGARHVAVAGTLMGLGVVAMHYIGMFGMRGCTPVYGLGGYLVSSVLSAAICTGALHVAYRRRSVGGLMVGGAAHGIAILAMHFSAMSQTGFLPLDQVTPTARMVPNDILAMMALVAAFLICGAFLLTTASLTRDAPVGADAMPAAAAPEGPQTRAGPCEGPLRLPYEQNGRTLFAPVDDIVAVQAEGRYTRLHRVSGPVFCPRPMTQVAKDLADARFLRTHRSYLVNLRYVQGFERRKDQGICLFAPGLGVSPVPVSRTKIAETKAALGL